MKTKLIKHYGDEILFAQSPNQADVITLKKIAATILRDFYKQPRNLDTEAEKLRVIKAAVITIYSDIKSMAISREEYPDSTAIENHRNYIPETLRQFLEQVIRKKDASLKISAIGQALVQSTRPNTVIAPLQIGLAVQMHITFGSRFLIDTLSHLCFCTSYTEVRKFELNAAVFYGIDLPETTDKHTVQFVADNVDHKSFCSDHRWPKHVPWDGNDCCCNPWRQQTQENSQKESYHAGRPSHLLLQVINLTTVISATYKSTTGGGKPVHQRQTEKSGRET